MDSCKNHRNTKQRDLIINELRKVYTHPTAKDVYKMVKKKMPCIGFATVYRSLDFLEKEGEIIKLNSKDKEARYDGHTNRHSHLICKICGGIDDVFDIKKLKIDSNEVKDLGFLPDFDHLEIQGVCKKCQNN